MSDTPWNDDITIAREQPAPEGPGVAQRGAAAEKPPLEAHLSGGAVTDITIIMSSSSR